MGGPALAGNRRTESPFINEVDQFTGQDGSYALPMLPYPENALEPHLDAQTLKIHHDKHHAGYVRGLNKAVEELDIAVKNNDYGLVKHWERELAFHGGGHYFHTLYWNSMSPAETKPSAKLNELIKKSFGMMVRFEEYFKAATAKVEASGWGVLAYEPVTDRLIILQVEKHQNQSPLMGIPLLVCDVWEHAYYLKYQNNRGHYIDSFMKLINWDAVSARLDAIKSAE